MRRAPASELSETQRLELATWTRSRTLLARQVSRAQVLLRAAAGEEDIAIAAQLGCARQRCARIRQRFLADGLEGMRRDAPRSGRPPQIDAKRIVTLTTTATPDGATDWSRALMAKATGVSESSVGRVWRANGLKPHQVVTFKLSRDPQFAEKLEAIVGLYLAPPERALVLCVDEKSQIQALDRTQPGLPLRTGHRRTITHDYKRHGTTTLFAALNTLDGTVIGSCKPRHRHQEFLRFLDQIDTETPSELDLHLVVDNYATHKHAAVRAWLEKHPRVQVHFTPTGSSWLNLVERFFRQLTDDVVREGSFASVKELVTAINVHLAHHNLKPTPYRWKAAGAAILEKIQRARLAQAKAVL